MLASESGPRSCRVMVLEGARPVTTIGTISSIRNGFEGMSKVAGRIAGATQKHAARAKRRELAFRFQAPEKLAQRIDHLALLHVRLLECEIQRERQRLVLEGEDEVPGTA